MLCVLLFLLAVSFTTASVSISGSNTISYHIYPTGNSPTSSSCNNADPASKWAGYVTASVVSGVQCGMCVQMTSSSKYGGNTIYVVRIDIGGQGFDLNQPAFNEMCGNQGYLDGHCDITWSVVDNSYCNSWIASHGASGQAYYGGSTTGGGGGGTVVSPKPTPTPTTGGSTGGSTGTNGCPSKYTCTSSNPGQNPAVNWPQYCSQKQGGLTFCQLGVSSCMCMPVSLAVADSEAQSASSTLSPGAWVGIGVVIGMVVVGWMVVVAILLIKRLRQSENI